MYNVSHVIPLNDAQFQFYVFQGKKYNFLIVSIDSLGSCCPRKTIFTVQLRVYTQCAVIKKKKKFPGHKEIVLIVASVFYNDKIHQLISIINHLV